jgi:excisionase family DNA binding protein
MRVKPLPLTSSTVSVQEAATILGVSVSTVRRLIAAREFPNLRRVLTVIRIPRSDIDAYDARSREFHVER